MFQVGGPPEGVSLSGEGGGRGMAESGAAAANSRRLILPELHGHFFDI